MAESRKRFISRVILLASVCICAIVMPLYQLAARGHESNGDRYYKLKQYDLARIEYDRAAEEIQKDEITKDRLNAKMGLCLLRQRNFRGSISTFQGNSFSILYLRMFGSLKGGFKSRFLLDQGELNSSEESAEKKELGQLLGGAVYLEDGDYDRGRTYFEQLQKSTESELIRSTTGSVLSSLTKFDEVPRKSPLLAGVMSAMIPGAGQIYSKHISDGITSFAFTGVLTASAIHMNRLETRAKTGHVGSGLLGVLGLSFYLVNITGAAASAQRYNNHQERMFQQEIREKYFNIDFVEKTSGITFETSF